MNEQIIAVDFDGTLCENKWPDLEVAKIRPYKLKNGINFAQFCFGESGL